MLNFLSINMRKKIFILTITFLLSAAFVSDADAQKRRPRRPAARRSAARRPLPPVRKTPPAAVTTVSGLTYLITNKGVGRQPKIGETVVVHYTGTLTNGVKFDSSYDRAAPITFRLGVGSVIKGWDEGIAKLHVGDRAILVIPANLGYGARGAGIAVPPNATLIFIVELVDIQTGAPGENP